MDTVGHGGQKVAEMGIDLQGALSLVGETVSSKHVSAVVRVQLGYNKLYV